MKNIIFSLVCAVVAMSSMTATAVERPNVVLIYADDLGIGMLGSYGQKLIKTPHIDRLAKEGMKFNNTYGGVLCAPARWTLLTGMHDGRKGGWGFNNAGFLKKLDREGVTGDEYMERFNAYVEKTSKRIPDDEVFLAQVAQKAGYTTAQFGKLDVGFLTNHDRVTRFGWDYYEGMYSHTRCHGFYPPYMWRNGEKFFLKGNTDIDCGKMSEKGNEPVGSGGETYSQNVFIEGILKFIREHKDEPFFLYHPTQLPHGPVAIPELHPDFADHPTLSLAEKKYASMVKMLDDHVGLIMEELKKQGLDDKTMVVFTSDNGHELYYGPKKSFPKHGLDDVPTNLTDNKWRTSEAGDVFDGNAGRAGLKRAAYQGGMQCPLIVRWPGKVKAGTESSVQNTHYDFMATLADVVGGRVPRGKDSISYLPTLLSKPQREVHDYVIINNRFNRMGKTALIGNDGWKLVEVERKNDNFQLYNIKEDNEERHNLADKHPEKVTTLKAILLRELESDRPDLKK
ncbi:MAG: arylsulfatase [Akkermansiaceae bacterium]